MDLHDYPRPKNDTGIGIHWSAGYAAAIGLGQIRERWLPELLAMGVKWVKIANHDGALGFVELLLQADIMPIVRMYRPQPNPGTLDQKALLALSDLVAAGVRYFEFNNEPDLGVEWQGRDVPPDAPRTVAQNAIVDMEAILARGGYPGVPALAPGTKWDLVGEICHLGRRDLFAEPVWQAIHNYSLNHPLDYPYDAGNQEGAPYTADFYGRLAAEQWGGDAWQGWSLQQVNDERLRGRNPGATAFDDPSCWRSYERYDSLIRNQIGRSLPLLATENGFTVGERPDPRYPATTPQLHMAQTLEACRIMMGVSTRFEPAPDYTFCTAFWLLGNYSLGSWSPEWEGQAWHSTRWPGGRLPIVDALMAEPKQVRRWRGETGAAGRVSGVVRAGSGAVVRLVRADPEPASGPEWAIDGRVGADERYDFIDLPLGGYRVMIPGAGQSRDVTLTREQPAAVVSFDLGGFQVAIEAGVVRGVVRGGAQRKVRLSRPADGWSQEAIAADDGSYWFAGLRAGVYDVALAGTDVGRRGIVLDGQGEAVVDMNASGWAWEVTDGGRGPGFGVVRCRVAGRVGVTVRLWTEGWEGASQRTGSKPEYGADVCEFAPLGAGGYRIEPQGLGVQADVAVDGSRVTWVTFTQGEAQPAQEGAIVGTLAGGAGRTLRLLLAGGAAPVGHARADAQGAFRFDKLAMGQYTIQVLEGAAGSAVVLERAGVAVVGSDPVRVDLALPAIAGGELRWVVEDGGKGPGSCVVRCRAGQPGRAVRIWSSGWGGITQISGSKSEYGADACEFAPLGPGDYFVEMAVVDDAGVARAVRTQVKLEPNRVVWVRFERTATPAPVEPEPAPAAGSVISGVVTHGRDGMIVLLQGPAVQARAAVQDGRYRFEGLGPGVYRLSVSAGDSAGELAVREAVMLDGANTASVDFVLAVPAPVKTVDHYLWVGSMVRSKADFLVVLRYVARFRPVVGTEEDEARQAQHVTILGGASAVSAAAEQGLRQSGCQVQRIEGDVAAVLGRLIDEDRPFAFDRDEPH